LSVQIVIVGPSSLIISPSVPLLLPSTTSTRCPTANFFYKWSTISSIMTCFIYLLWHLMVAIFPKISIIFP
jgi:hypothetical protein